MTKRIVLGITGRKYAGKDSFAAALRKAAGERTIITTLALANPLKEGLHVALGLRRDQLWGDKKEVPDRRFRSERHPEGITPRELMQGFGEWGREWYEDIWVMRLREKMDEIEQNFPEPGLVPYQAIWLITDVRHFNEANAVQRLLNGKMVRVIRPGSSTGQFENHESEKWVDALPVDYLVQNNGTLEDLDALAANVYRDLLENNE